MSDYYDSLPRVTCPRCGHNSAVLVPYSSGREVMVRCMRGMSDCGERRSVISDYGGDNPTVPHLHQAAEGVASVSNAASAANAAAWKKEMEDPSP